MNLNIIIPWQHTQFLHCISKYIYSELIGLVLIVCIVFGCIFILGFEISEVGFSALPSLHKKESSHTSSCEPFHQRMSQLARSNESNAHPVR